MLNSEEINNVIKQSILNVEPMNIGKLGSVEASALFLKDRYGEQLNWDTLAHGWTLRKAISFQTGVYPSDDSTLHKWSSVYLNSLREMDYLLEWCPEYGDKYIIDKFCHNTKIFKQWEGFEPWYVSDSWIGSLENKKILVVSPFKDTILKQSEIFDKVWPDYGIKPQKVNVIKTKFSFDNSHVESNSTYFTELERIKNEILDIDFDVAILGCGSYAIPLMAYIKKLDIPAIHLGGGTQILFGIRGKRWDDSETYKKSKFYNNPYWTRAEQSDIPKNNTLIEQGCYW